MNSNYTIITLHVQHMARNALELATLVHNHKPGDLIDVTEFMDGTLHLPAKELIRKAVVDLQHAAAELEEEELSCEGWAQW